MKTSNDVHHHKTFGWLGATLMSGSLLVLLGTGCASTSTDDTAMEDIEVLVPSQADADASASHAITADNAAAELQKLEDEVAADQN